MELATDSHPLCKVFAYGSFHLLVLLDLMVMPAKSNKYNFGIFLYPINNQSYCNV